MSPEVLVLLVVFVGLMLLNVPIAVCIGLSTVATIATLGDVPTGYIVAQRMASGIASFPLLAIPFFVLSGILMGDGGMARRLMDFAYSLVGRFQGGLAYVNTLTCMLFGAVSGSATAAVSSIGGFMIPQMEEKGYKREFAVALTATSATTGLLIPPSNIMIVFAVVSGNVSVAALFMAGVVPGLVVGLSIMAASAFILAIRPPAKVAQSAAEMAAGLDISTAFIRAIPTLLLAAVVLGGILGGIFSATEASAIAVVYSAFIGLFVMRTLKLSDIPDVLTRAGMTSAVVLLLVGAAMAFKTVASLSHTPELMASIILGLSDNPLVLLFLINVLLLIVGMFLDAGPAIIILGPILGPIFTSIGIDSVHFAIIMAVNLTVGLLTPPMGLVLFVTSSVSGLRVETIAKATLPFLTVEILIIFLITYFPAISLTVPRLFGFVH